MENIKLLRLSVTVLFFSCFLAACNAAPGADQYVGDYYGTTAAGNTTFVASVSAVGRSTDNQLSINSHLVEDPTQSPLQGTLIVHDSNTLEVAFSHGLNYIGELSRDDQGCFSGTAGTTTLRFCPTPVGFSIQLSKADSSEVSSLVFKHATQEEISKLEPPQAYTSSQLRDLSANRSFQDRNEIEQVLQAKLSSRGAYLNLLPHLNIGSALSVSQYSGLLSGAGLVGDLAPFLLPDRWFQANETKDMAQSEILALLIMKLDTMQSVEALCISLVRDNVIDAQLQKDLVNMQAIESQIQSLESAGKLTVGSADAIGSTMNIIAQTDSDLQSNIALEYTALAQAVGFINPNAVSAVTLDSFGDITQPTTYDLPTLETAAVAFSPELAQLTSLFAAAKAQKNARAFQWLDPAGDDQGSLGAGLSAYLQISRSSVDEVSIERDQTNSTVLKEVTDNLNNYNGWIESYQLAQQGLAIDARRLGNDTTLLSTGGAGLEMAELQDTLQQLSVNQINLVTAQYAWYGNVSLFSRLLGEGAYRAQLTP